MNATIRPKPAGSRWTDEQWKAIAAGGRDILVAAAAGSGKTAVLVERIIQKVTAEEGAVDIDRLLVVTFTNAAAAEMKARIGEALERELAKRPHSLHLRRQLSLLNRASISTLHSFCLDVIRKYYYLLDLDPSFRIADETEIELLKEDVLEELLEEQYGKADNERFFAVVDAYTGDRSDAELQEMILALYEFSRSHPAPDEWLANLVSMYGIDEQTPIETLPPARYIAQHAAMELAAAKRLIGLALKLAEKERGPKPYKKRLDEDMDLIADLEKRLAGPWDELHRALQSLSFGRLPACRGDGYEARLIDEAKSLRDQVKKKIEALRDNVFSFRPSTWLRHMREMKPVVETIVALVRRFSAMFEAAKREKGIVDFSDLEHYCLRVLRQRDPETGEWQPSSAALEYQAQFDEVLVDEYQDTNLVQETILQLVKKGSERTGNLFMVGDVKQSIYRFRLAEPMLFLDKYKRFTADGEAGGMKIDLASNFRSRAEVLNGANFLFAQIMGEAVGEMAYDEAAQLTYGADYPDGTDAVPEVMIINRQRAAEEGEEEAAELEAAELEARLMAEKIKETVSRPFYVYDRSSRQPRRAMYRDIVVLVRSMTNAPQLIEQLQAHGIPAAADLSSGYFQATEISVMLSLLKVIDNPYQDIPLAAVLRSPLFRFDENELAMIRLSDPKGAFFEALQAFRQKPAETDEEENAKKKAIAFLDRLEEWRTMARRRSLADLIWQLYRDTQFYDFVGALPGGKQRQANLRALYDRARQYESTSFRGLFRFLRFIERLQERGDDLGAARQLGEQEDVVRVMTIHSSKGLEFPIVFLAGLARPFYTRDLHSPYLLDKELGFAARFVHPQLRISYPTLPLLAIQVKKRLELLAEEMRVLYVALTRAKEKLYLLASVNDADKEIEKWKSIAAESGWLLPDDVRASARSYLDWIGRALIRHRDGCALIEADASAPPEIASHPSVWRLAIVPAAELRGGEMSADREDGGTLAALEQGRPVPTRGEWEKEARRRLLWRYRYEKETAVRAKQSVSELKEQRVLFGEQADEWLPRKGTAPLFARPRFMQEKTLTPAEKGTALHVVMRHLDLHAPMDESSIRSQIIRLVEKELLSAEQAEAVDAAAIIAFFATDIGRRLCAAGEVYREVPFSLGLPVDELYGGEGMEGGRRLLVQGVVDCVFADEHGYVVIDYKTDEVTGRFAGQKEAAVRFLLGRYGAQMRLYRRAIEQIWRVPVAECYLYSFDGGYFLAVE
ncbi:helicase-exonuclease AddAB subunit AddA [Geobacillus sp. 46C-IIa]|uniref:helicase-exonuclease AddAB subunit AddA n=1 Tax=Geobacillus sp. 46C-IIa TaxID=1963025 RepID=UPI0009C084BD|nr:helicase-exonuclease AddAB subunit AddA [Geobacillus sp. 46C-IIa]OQP06953.1 helicase-exonuclease AddAB subunit AddA [Geobacillus sp. 46C-IIa]QNU27326.1 helicase-exonuclease AddAB subunit AddA [Geobacillus sp. 46C-IIa]